MDSYPFASHSKFVELLSQQTLSFGNNKDSVELSSSQVPFQSSLGTDASNYDRDNAAGRKGRRKWTPTDDVVLISSWLNTSNDPVVGNEQKSSGFWKRIAAYFAASPLVAGCEERERQAIASNDGPRSMTLCQSSVACTKLLLERKQAARMRLVFSSLFIKYSTTTRRDLLLNTLGRNCDMTRSGATLLLVKTKGAQRRGSVRTVQIPLALKQLAPSVPRVWRPQRWVLRSRW